MKHILSIIIFLICTLSVYGQPIERKVADSLLLVLTNTRQADKRIPASIRLAQFHIFKPGENQVDFDSASRYLSEARQLNESIKSTAFAGQCLLTESYMLRENGHKDSAILKLEEAIKILEATNDKYYLGKTLYELSGYYDYQTDEEFNKKVNLVERSVAAFERCDSTLEKAEALKMLGDLYNIDLRYGQALETLNRALAAYNFVHHKPLQGVYSLLSIVNTSLNDYKQALYYGLLAVKTAESCNDTTIQVCQINHNLATLYGTYGSFEKALKYYKDALKIAIRYSDTHAVALIAYNISACYIVMEQPRQSLDFLLSISPNLNKPTNVDDSTFFALSFMKAYLGLKNYARAYSYFTILLAIDSRGTMATNLALVFNRTAADYYIGIKNYSNARFYISRNANGYPKSAGPKSFSVDEKLRYKIDSAQGNYQSALYHLLNHKTISDSLLNETKSRQLQELEVEYETAKKEDSLQQKNQYISLLLQKNNLQLTTLKQSNRIKNITIIGIVFTLVILGLLYYQFRVNQRKSKIILQKNEELKEMLAEKEWWLKEVHHRVKNNLHTIICLLESQAMYLDKDALQAIEKSQHRIYAMSLIHQKLYQNEDLQVIDMAVYLEEFIGYLRDSFDAEKIDFVIKVDPVQLNLQQAIPVALIINEGVTNSIKYAFTDQSEPRISISMTEEEEKVHLIINDNGRGFELKEGDEGKSLGLQLIRGLGKELKGNVIFDTKKGTNLSVEFRKGPLHDQMTYIKTDIIDEM